MKAAVYMEPGCLAINDVDDPVPGPGGLVLDVDACAICGTDLRIYRHGHHRISPPAIIGHEIAGSVAALGEGVTGWRVGDHVVLAPPAWSCGSCRACLGGKENLCEHRRALAYELPGGFAEKVAVPAPLVAGGCLHSLPEGTDPAIAAITEPLACCINGQKHLNMKADARAIVIGAGPIGLMHALLLKGKGVREIGIIDKLAVRIDRVTGSDSFMAFDGGNAGLADQVSAWSGGCGADLVVVAASSPDAYRSAFELVGRGGAVLLFAGLPFSQQEMLIDMNMIHYKELALYGSFASMPDQSREALETLTTGPPEFADLVTHSFPLDGIEEAFRTAGSLEGLKVVVRPRTS